MIDLEAGVLLLSATLPMCTRTFALWKIGRQASFGNVKWNHKPLWSFARFGSKMASQINKVT